MIGDQEVRTRASALRVPEEQIRRDHLLSHLIHAMRDPGQIILIGGTALNRTHLPDLRVSEDLDIHLLEGDPNELVEWLIESVRLEFSGLRPRQSRASGDVSTSLLASGEETVRVQIIRRRREWLGLPSSPTAVRLYYSDLPQSIELEVPTPPAFAAMKLAAFADRKAPRDLFDLSKLAELGAVDKSALALFRTLTGRAVVAQDLQPIPSDAQWHADLGHQTADPGQPKQAAAVVSRTLALG